MLCPEPGQALSWEQFLAKAAQVLPLGRVTEQTSCHSWTCMERWTLRKDVQIRTAYTLGEPK